MSAGSEVFAPPLPEIGCNCSARPGMSVRSVRASVAGFQAAGALREVQEPFMEHPRGFCASRASSEGEVMTQSRRDALADADTLRRNVYRAVANGATNSRILRTHDYLRLAAMGSVVMLHPEEAARAAFRAVPGLRG